MASGFVLDIQALIQCFKDHINPIARLIFLELVHGGKKSVSKFFLALHPNMGTAGREFVGTVGSTRRHRRWRNHNETCQSQTHQTRIVVLGSSDVVRELACDRSRSALSGHLGPVTGGGNLVDHSCWTAIMV